nr:hypothetical protein [uncultured Flavobacterium sp.]
MKKLSEILFYLTFFLVTFGQAQDKLPQRDIDTLFTKALIQRVDWQLTSGYKYVDLENQGNIPIEKFQNGMIKILPQNQIINVSRKEGKELTVHTLNYLIISRDTVDVNFGEYYVKGLKAKNKKSPLAIITENKCQGTRDSYIPNIRFVLINGEWKIIRSKFYKN